MDVTVTPGESGNVWELTDLLGRSLGQIQLTADRRFMIFPAGLAVETMAEMNRGPFATLDVALSEIETHTRGACRLSALARLSDNAAEGADRFADDVH